jgi:hypothetical protein
VMRTYGDDPQINFRGAVVQDNCNPEFDEMFVGR